MYFLPQSNDDLFAENVKSPRTHTHEKRTPLKIQTINKVNYCTERVYTSTHKHWVHYANEDFEPHIP